MRPEIEKDLIPPSDSRNPGVSDLSAATCDCPDSACSPSIFIMNTPKTNEIEARLKGPEPMTDILTDLIRLCEQMEAERAEAIEIARTAISGIESIYGHAQFCDECHSFEMAQSCRNETHGFDRINSLENEQVELPPNGGSESKKGVVGG